MTNKDRIADLIKKHPEGLDDDDLSKMTGIKPRQQVQQLCSQLASEKRILRQSVTKPGKRRKVHNFPLDSAHFLASADTDAVASTEGWRRWLAALVGATGRTESDLLEEALQSLALKVLGAGNVAKK